MKRYTRKQQARKERVMHITIIALLLALVVALTALFAPKNNGNNKAYSYDLGCLTELHENPLMECRKE